MITIILDVNQFIDIIEYEFMICMFLGEDLSSICDVAPKLIILVGSFLCENNCVQEI